VTLLLDGNVLVALTVVEHVHHDAAASWFASTSESFATTPITQGTLLRFLVRSGTTSADAMVVLERLLQHARHEFWPDADPYHVAMLRGVVGHRQITDAYLVASARARGGRLATFDRGIAAAYADAVVAIPLEIEGPAQTS
jgi:toxin-antitoxin system PIN domain toxin